MALRRVRPLAERFWEKVRLTENCWLWEGALKANGYGTIGRGRSSEGKVHVHRLSWELANGPIPEGMEVCHKCDIRRCVNPAHLFVASHAANVRDMVEKNRQQHGERHYGAILKANQVQEIRQMIASGISDATIGAEFGVSPHTIGNIRRGHRWKSVH